MGLNRAAKRRGSAAPDRFEAENVDFHQKLREAYHRIAVEHPERGRLRVDWMTPARRNAAGPRR